MAPRATPAQTSITIRGLDPALKQRLRERAARNGRSMEAEAREILKSGVGNFEESGLDFLERIHARFAAIGGADLQLPPRGPGRPLPTFEPEP